MWIMKEKEDIKSIKSIMAELEYQYYKYERSVVEIEDIIRRSIARTERSLNCGTFSYITKERLYELLSEKKNSYNDFIVERDQIRYAYRTKIEQYKEKIRNIEKDDIK